MKSALGTRVRGHDFSTGVRGTYAKRYAKGVTVLRVKNRVRKTQ